MGLGNRIKIKAREHLVCAALEETTWEQRPRRWRAEAPARAAPRRGGRQELKPRAQRGLGRNGDEAGIALEQNPRKNVLLCG